MKAGLYVHIPFCRSRCDYCSFVSCCDFSLQKDYYFAVKNRIGALGKDEIYDTIYFGGGTPSAVPQLLTAIYDLLSSAYNIEKNREFTVECNPDSVDDGFIAALEKMNCNRVSVGLQAAQDGLLKAVNRRHDFRAFGNAVKLLNNVTQNISADVMIGLPSQTVSDVTQTIEQAVCLGAKHISVYALKVESGTPLYDRGYKPDEDMQADMYDAAYELMKSLGFRRYEVSNFCLPGYECKHNLKYWRLEDYLGIGAAAHSLIDGKRYAEGGLKEFLAGKPPEITDVKADFVEEYIMLGLRTADGVRLDVLKERGCDILREKADAIEKYIKLNLLQINEGFLRLTDKAFYVMNTIIADLI